MPLKLSKTIISFILFGLVWKIASLGTNSLVLPSPEQVVASLAGILIEPHNWTVIAGTAVRALAGMLAAVLSGVFMAIVLSPLTPYLRPVITLLQNVPLVSWILLAIIWFGFSDASVSFVVFTATVPVIYLNTITGLNSISPHLGEMSQNFRLPPVLKWYSIDLASVGSHISAGVSVAIAIMWKSVVMAELFASVRGVGFAMETSRTYLQTDRLMAWTLLLVILGLTSDLAWRLLIKSGLFITIYHSGLAWLPVRPTAKGQGSSAGESLTIENMSKGYRQDGTFVGVLDSLSLNLRPGETVSLSGPSGTGKTTLLRIIAGLERPDSGQVSRNGRIPCLMFQEPRLLPWLTAEQNIALVLRRQMPYREALAKALEMLGVLGIPGELYPPQLSGGMQKAVSLARTLAARGDVILLDEPFSSSDTNQKKRMMQLIKRTTRPGDTVLIVSHHNEELIFQASVKLKLEGSPASLCQTAG
ncbi:MAG: hypothetical protein JL50_19780 [Peptococcaceae bacterium BICA1-7]|nr:MAG: hypothetical protein JL50_19780 [Peptococcaceae bacterium BICA1-7]HBV98318.1 hypothetical protein [Desulfotomaculum sp.]